MDKAENRFYRSKEEHDEVQTMRKLAEIVPELVDKLIKCRQKLELYEEVLSGER